MQGRIKVKVCVSSVSSMQGQGRAGQAGLGRAVSS